MREVVTFHIGQFGTQLGAACWEINCQEHSISSYDGRSIKQNQNQDLGNTQVLFQECQQTKFTPRAIFVDLEEDTIHQIKKKQEYLHHPSNFIFTKDGGDFATRAHYTIGKEVIDPVLDRTRVLLEQCDSMEGFIFHHSISGGTGSGFTSLLREHLSLDYGKKVFANMTLFPSGRMSTEIVEPYNAVLNFRQVLTSSLTFVLDNAQLYKLCTRNIGIQSPSYVHINEILAKLNSYLTLSSRFGGSVNVSLQELLTNLVSHRTLQYIQTALAPLTSSPSDAIQSQQDENHNLLLKQLVDPCNIMSSCNTETKGVSLASSALFAGVKSPTQMIQSVNQLQPTPWWDPAQCKYGFISRSSGSFPKSCDESGNSVLNFKKHIEEFTDTAALFVNHTSIHRKLAILASQFDKMYAKRAFVHWFVGEGLESGEFSECREDVEILIQEYKQMEKMASTNETLHE